MTLRTVVTGASRGIGEAAARALARRGDRLVLIQRGEAVVAAETGAQVIRCDLTDAEAAVGALEDAATALGGIDVLVVNAAGMHRGPVLDVPLAELRRVVDLDLISPFALSQAAARRMVDQGGGAIVLVASILSFQGGFHTSPYSIAKAGVPAIARVLANELGQHGVRANCVAPGYVATDINRSLREDPERHAAITGRIPQGRWGTVDEIAETIAWLSSPASSYVNGTTLVADGGWLGR